MFSQKNIFRIEGLDHLRGIAALGVSIYHYSMWSGLAVPVEIKSVLAFFGIYGVEIFFILSGSSLYLSMAGKAAHGWLPWIQYAVRRVFRIYPLFLCALALALIGRYIANPLSLYKITLLRYLSNSTLTFGFVDPSMSLVPAGWTVGLEVFFYVLFPFFYLQTRNKIGYEYLVGIFVTVGLLYTWLAIDPDVPLNEQWAIYVSPVNHLLFFLVGIWMGNKLVAGQHIRNNAWLMLGTVIAAALMCIYAETEITMVTGLWRPAFLVVCILMVYSMASMVHKTGVFLSAIDWLGKISYSVYLLHFFAYALAEKWVSHGLSGGTHVIIVGYVILLIISWASYKFVEMPFQEAGRNFNRLISRNFVSSEQEKA